MFKKGQKVSLLGGGVCKECQWSKTCGKEGRWLKDDLASCHGVGENIHIMSKKEAGAGGGQRCEMRGRVLARGIG